VSAVDWRANPLPLRAHSQESVLREETIIYDDRELVARVLRDGSSAAFLGLYERYTPRLLRFVSRISGSADDTFLEDLVQETWMRSMTVLHRFDWGSTLATWLHGIALNVTREAIRREQRFGVGDADETAIADLATLSVERSHEQRIDLERALQRLPEGRRTVLVLHDLEGYTHDEIANALGISTGTSKSQLHDARSQLRKLLSEVDTHVG
jgi:RNA polymerase sigma-70 factor, ECF subfamily